MALAVVVVGVVGGFYLWAHESVALLRPTSAEGQQTPRRGSTRRSHAAIALVLGYDHRAGDGTRALALGHDDADPRRPGHEHDLDALVPARPAGPDLLPAKGGGAPSRAAAINSAYAYCGSAGALETVRHLTNLPINYLISVNFLGFIGVVNKLGGVWLDVDRRYYNKNVGTSATDFANINLQPGYQRLTGKQALDFVRFRHTDSDLYRLARQQQFVGAARQQVAELARLDEPRRDRQHDHPAPLHRDRRGGAGSQPERRLQLRDVRVRPARTATSSRSRSRARRPERALDRPDQHPGRRPAASSTRTSRPPRPRPTSRSGRRSVLASARCPPPR